MAMVLRVQGLIIGLVGLTSLFGAAFHVAVLKFAPVKPLRCAHAPHANMCRVRQRNI